MENSGQTVKFDSSSGHQSRGLSHVGEDFNSCLSALHTEQHCEHARSISIGLPVIVFMLLRTTELLNSQLHKNTTNAMYHTNAL